MSTYRAPLPLDASGVQSGVNQALTAADLARIQANLARKQTLLAAGLTQTTGPDGKPTLGVDHHNPVGAYQQVQDQASSASADRGFGYSGRMAELYAKKPTYDVVNQTRSELQNQYAPVQAAGDAADHTVAQAGQSAAAYGVNQEAFYAPRRQAMRRRTRPAGV